MCVWLNVCVFVLIRVLMFSSKNWSIEGLGVYERKLNERSDNSSSGVLVREIGTLEAFYLCNKSL